MKWGKGVNKNGFLGVKKISKGFKISIPPPGTKQGFKVTRPGVDARRSSERQAKTRKRRAAAKKKERSIKAKRKAAIESKAKRKAKERGQKQATAERREKEKDTKFRASREKEKKQTAAKARALQAARRKEKERKEDASKKVLKEKQSKARKAAEAEREAASKKAATVAKRKAAAIESKAKRAAKERGQKENVKAKGHKDWPLGFTDTCGRELPAKPCLVGNEDIGLVWANGTQYDTYQNAKACGWVCVCGSGKALTPRVNKYGNPLCQTSGSAPRFVAVHADFRGGMLSSSESKRTYEERWCGPWSRRDGGCYDASRTKAAIGNLREAYTVHYNHARNKNMKAFLSVHDKRQLTLGDAQSSAAVRRGRGRKLLGSTFCAGCSGKKHAAKIFKTKQRG